jgi:ubiquinone/menaquinone biosynthesis C-methylase UbiE
MNTSASDSWFKRRMMKLTLFEKWSVNNPRHARHTVQTAQTLLEYVDLPPQPRCLEIGCGQGALARLLVEQYGARMIASDYDPAQVAVAQERLADIEGQVEFRVVDGREMPFGDTQFDALFSFGVLHHIPGGWRQVVAEAARVLKPSGWFLFTDFVLPPRADRWLRRLLPRLDQLEEMVLHDCLAENGLHLGHYEYDRAILAGMMRYCIGVAHKT